MVYGAPLNTHCTALDGRPECGFRTPCALADELEAAEGGTALDSVEAGRAWGQPQHLSNLAAPPVAAPGVACLINTLLKIKEP